MNLREQFDRDTKGHASFQEYCREEVDKKLEKQPLGDQIRKGFKKEFKRKTRATR